MESNSKKINEFLIRKNIAIAGVSRDPKKGTGIFIYNKFKDAGYNVFAVNPYADEINGVKCYRNVKSIPEKIDAVFTVTHPNTSLAISKECAEAGIKMLWFHRFVGQGSYSAEAEEFCKENNIDVITSGCPVMYLRPVDFAHKCFKFFLNISGKLK